MTCRRLIAYILVFSCLTGLAPITAWGGFMPDPDTRPSVGVYAAGDIELSKPVTAGASGGAVNLQVSFPQALNGLGVESAFIYLVPKNQYDAGAPYTEDEYEGDCYKLPYDTSGDPEWPDSSFTVSAVNTFMGVKLLDDDYMGGGDPLPEGTYYFVFELYLDFEHVVDDVYSYTFASSNVFSVGAAIVRENISFAPGAALTPAAYGLGAQSAYTLSFAPTASLSMLPGDTITVEAAGVDFRAATLSSPDFTLKGSANGFVLTASRALTLGTGGLSLTIAGAVNPDRAGAVTPGLAVLTATHEGQTSLTPVSFGSVQSAHWAEATLQASDRLSGKAGVTYTLTLKPDADVTIPAGATLTLLAAGVDFRSAAAGAPVSLKDPEIGSAGLQFTAATVISASAGITLTLTGVTNPAAGGEKDCGIAALDFTAGNSTWQIAAKTMAKLMIDAAPGGTYLLFSPDAQKTPLFPAPLPGVTEGAGSGSSAYLGGVEMEYARLRFTTNYIYQLPADTTMRLSGAGDRYAPVYLDADDVLVIYNSAKAGADDAELCRFTAAELSAGSLDLYPILKAADKTSSLGGFVFSLLSGKNGRYGAGDIYLHFASAQTFNFRVSYERPYYYFDLLPLPESGWIDANYQAVTVRTNLPGSVDISGWTEPYLLTEDGAEKLSLPAGSRGELAIPARLHIPNAVSEAGASAALRGFSLYPYGYAPRAEQNFVYSNADAADRYMLQRYYQDLRGGMNRYSVPKPDMGTNANHLPVVYSLQTFDLRLDGGGEGALFIRSGKDMYHGENGYEPLGGAVAHTQSDTLTLTVYSGDVPVYTGSLTNGVLDAELGALPAGNYRGELALTAAAQSRYGVGPMFLLYSADVTVSGLTHVTPETQMGGDFGIRAGEPRSPDDPAQTVTPVVGETFLLPVIVDRADFPVTYMMDGVTGRAADCTIGKRHYQNGRSWDDGSLTVAPVTGPHFSAGYFSFPTPAGALQSTGYYSAGDVIYYLEVTPRRSGNIILNFASYEGASGEANRTLTQASFSVNVPEPPKGVPSGGWYSPDGVYNFVLSGEGISGASVELRAGDVTLPCALSTQIIGGDSVLVASGASPAPAGLYTLYINNEPAADAKGQPTEMALAAPAPLMRSEKVSNPGIYLGHPNHPVWRVYNDGAADGYAVVDFTFPGNLAGAHLVTYMVSVHNGRWFISDVEETVRRPHMPLWGNFNQDTAAWRIRDNPPDEDRVSVYTASVVVPVAAGDYTDITWQISADWWSENALKGYSFIYVGESVSASFTDEQWQGLGLSGELSEEQFGRIIEAYCTFQNNGALIAPMLNYNFDTFGLEDKTLAPSIPELVLPGVSQNSHLDYETYKERLALYKSLLKKDQPKIYEYVYGKIYNTVYGDSLLFPYYESLAFDSWQNMEEPAAAFSAQGMIQPMKIGIKDIIIPLQDVHDFAKDVTAINKAINVKYGSYSCNANNTFDSANAVKLESARVLLGRMPNTALLASLLGAGKNGHDAAVKMRARTLAYGLNQLCRGMEAYGGLDSMSIDQALALIKQECLPQNDGTNFGVQESLFSFVEMYQVFVNTQEGRDPYHPIQQFGYYEHINESTNDRYAAMLLLTYKIYKVNKKNGINYNLLDFLRGTADEELPPLVLDPCTHTSRNPSTTVKNSYDPNSLTINPDATGDEKWVAPGDEMKVTIQFENDAEATAPARNVYIELPVAQNGFRLDALWDMSSIELVASSYTDGEGGMLAFPVYSEEAGVLSFCLPGINLPPNAFAPEGEGYVTFTVNVREDAAPGAFIKPAADIFFDFNDPVSTDSEEYPAPLRTVAGAPEIGDFTASGTGASWTVARQYGDIESAVIRCVNTGTKAVYAAYAERPGENAEPRTSVSYSLPAGEYAVTLTLTDVLGFEDSETQTLTVAGGLTGGSSGGARIEETQVPLAVADGVLTIDCGDAADVAPDPEWFGGVYDSLRLLLPGGAELIFGGEILQYLAEQSAEGKINISFSAGDGAVDFDISKNGESLSWYNYRPFLLVGIPGEGALMENKRTGRIIARSWCADGMVYARVYAPGSYGIRQVTPQSFVDTAGLWMDGATSRMAAREVILGVGGDAFAPGENVTRAQFVTMLMRVLQIEPPAEGLPEQFADVPEGAYYHDAALQARALGIVSGTGMGRFNPDAEITRQDMFVMLFRAMERMGMELPQPATEKPGSFADDSEISDYAREAISALVEAGIVSGVGGGRLEPMGGATRAQAAQLLYNVLLKDAVIA